MAQPETLDKPPASYRRTVDRIVDYLESLPEEAKSMWVDAAYRIYAESLIDGRERTVSPKILT